LKFLYTTDGQELAAKNYYRPRDPEVARKHADVFTKVQLFTIDEVFGGWRAAQAKHFAERGVFDDIYSQ
ncbi:MAG: sulfate ABC transporter substrate-binding protein, partial [Rhodoplanes sp.]